MDERIANSNEKNCLHVFLEQNFFSGLETRGLVFIPITTIDLRVLIIKVSLISAFIPLHFFHIFAVFIQQLEVTKRSVQNFSLQIFAIVQ